MSGDAKVDGRKVLKPKSLVDWYEGIDLLVKILNNRTDEIAINVKEVQADLKGINEEDVDSFIDLDLNEIDSSRKYSYVAEKIKALNNQRECIGRDVWAEWGSKIRNRRHNQHHSYFKVSKSTKEDVFKFVLKNRAYINSFLSDGVLDIELKGRAYCSFDELLNEKSGVNVSSYDDMLIRTLLKLSSEWVAFDIWNLDDIADESSLPDEDLIRRNCSLIKSRKTAVSIIKELEVSLKEERKPVNSGFSIISKESVKSKFQLIDEIVSELEKGSEI